MNNWTKETALIQLKRAEKRYTNWKLEVSQNPSDNFKRDIMNGCEEEVKRMYKIYRQAV